MFEYMTEMQHLAHLATGFGLSPGILEQRRPILARFWPLGRVVRANIDQVWDHIKPKSSKSAHDTDHFIVSPRPSLDPRWPTDNFGTRALRSLGGFQPKLDNTRLWHQFVQVWVDVDHLLTGSLPFWHELRSSTSPENVSPGGHQRRPSDAVLRA